MKAKFYTPFCKTYAKPLFRKFPYQNKLSFCQKLPDKNHGSVPIFL
jgi:hypothetical protein